MESLDAVSSNAKEDPKAAVDQGSTANSADWGDHGWFYVSVRMGFFLWVALLNLITISSTWARVIDVMDSEAQDCLGSLVLVLHLASYLVLCLPLGWLFWVHIFSSLRLV